MQIDISRNPHDQPFSPLYPNQPPFEVAISFCYHHPMRRCKCGQPAFSVGITGSYCRKHIPEIIGKYHGAEKIAQDRGISLCPCGKDASICPDHKIELILSPRSKPYSRKVTDPKTGCYPTYDDWKLSRQEELRKYPTPTEKLLFHALKASNDLNPKGWAFQPIIFGFIPDFAHELAKVIVEADGDVHNTTAARRSDARRDNIFRVKGWAVKRFTNSQIQNHLEFVVSSISTCVHARLNGRERGNP